MKNFLFEYLIPAVLLTLLLCLLFGTPAHSQILQGIVGGKAAGGGGACTTSNDSSIFDYTGDAIVAAGGINYTTPASNVCPRFTIGAAYTITRYRINVTDVNHAGYITLSLYNDNANAVGTMVASSTSEQLTAATISDSPTFTQYYLNITTPLSLAAGTYWICPVVEVDNPVDAFQTNSVSKAGARVDYQSAYYDNYSAQFGIYGCAQ